MLRKDCGFVDKNEKDFVEINLNVSFRFRNNLFVFFECYRKEDFIYQLFVDGLEYDLYLEEFFFFFMKK